MHDFIAQYYFDLKEQVNRYPFALHRTTILSKFLEEVTYTEVWKYENYFPSLRLT